MLPSLPSSSLSHPTAFPSSSEASSYSLPFDRYHLFYLLVAGAALFFLILQRESLYSMAGRAFSFLPVRSTSNMNHEKALALLKKQQNERDLIAHSIEKGGSSQEECENLAFRYCTLFDHISPVDQWLASLDINKVPDVRREYAHFTTLGEQISQQLLSYHTKTGGGDSETVSRQGILHNPILIQKYQQEREDLMKLMELLVDIHEDQDAPRNILALFNPHSLCNASIEYIKKHSKFPRDGKPRRWLSLLLNEDSPMRIRLNELNTLLGSDSSEGKKREA